MKEKISYRVTWKSGGITYTSIPLESKEEAEKFAEWKRKYFDPVSIEYFVSSQLSS